MISIISVLLALSGAPATPSEDSIVGAVSMRPTSRLRMDVDRRDIGVEGPLSALFLAVADTSFPAQAAVAALDSLHRVQPTALRSALLGTAEALCARGVRDKPLEATRWVGKAIAHLDAAVKDDPKNPTIRVFRINALREVPQIFHVEERLEADAAMLKKAIGKKYRTAPGDHLMAVAAVAWRAGRSKEAVACWKIVASRGAKDGASAEARRQLAAGAR